MSISLKRFAVASAVLIGVTALVTNGNGFLPLQSATASAGSWLASLFGAQTTVLGNTIVTASGPLNVVDACLPLGIIAVFAALVISTETSNRHRLTGLAMALGVVVVANVIRVAIAVWAAQMHTEAFAYLHKGLMQMFPEALLFVPWLAWSGAEHRREAGVFAMLALALAVAFSFAWPALQSGYVVLTQHFPEAASSGRSGVQPVGASPWLITGVALLVAARGAFRRKAVMISALLASVIVADVALTLLVSATGLGAYREALMRSSLTFMAPLIAVVIYVRGRPSALWWPETTSEGAAPAQIST